MKQAVALAVLVAVVLAPQAAMAQAPASLRAAIQDLAATFGERYPGGPALLTRLDDVERRLASATGDEKAKAEADLAALTREALIANPLVSGAPIAYAWRSQYIEDHHNTETMFQTGEICTDKFRGPGALRVVDFRDGGKVRTILAAPTGVIRDPQVHFDGRRIVFSMRRDIRDDYHIFEINADGTGLRQLTFGSGLSDIDPLYLPDGRIVFTSTREPKYCMCNRHIMGNLFRMDADGANVHQIGHSTLHEGHGVVTPDGRILYDRWEYIDRNFGDAQGLWTVNPDGTNHAVYWGNNTKCPGAVLDGHVLPGHTEQFIAIFSSCHDRPWGALAIVDRSRGVDGRAPVLRTWPPESIEYVMKGDLDTYKRVPLKFEDPWPLSDKYFLASRQVAKGDEMGIYLLDVFGNEIRLHADAPGCFDPQPLVASTPPPIVPDRVQFDRSEGMFYIQNVYTGTGMDRVKPGAVKTVRVVESPEKRFWTNPSWDGQGQEAPAMNWHDFNNKRILGTAPVEADGSAYFEVPADRYVYFQLLDENGMMVQSMRSGTIVRPGETAGCGGCHEDRLSAAPNAPTQAIRKPASKLVPWRGPTREFAYTQEVQQVFDRNCLRCHDVGGPGTKKLTLAGDRGLAFNISYHELWQKRYIKVVGAGPAEVQMPYSWGSHASRIVQVLRAGHNDVKLDAESFDRLVTWIDLNAPYYPTYASAYPDNLYGRSPLDGKQLDRLTALTGVAFKGHDGDTQVNLTRPERSPCLGSLKDKSDPKYQEALAIIQAGKEMLARRPQADMPGFKLEGIEAARQAKYEERARIETEVRRAILKGEKVYPYKPATSGE